MDNYGFNNGISSSIFAENRQEDRLGCAQKMLLVLAISVKNT